jgi:uncharacterized membrane-anchored protein YhcB (DUF1043 family)
MVLNYELVAQLRHINKRDTRHWRYRAMGKVLSLVGILVCLGMMYGCGGGKSEEVAGLKKDIGTINKEITDLKAQLAAYRKETAEVAKQTANVIDKLKEALQKLAEAKRQTTTQTQAPAPTQRSTILEEERIREEARQAERDKDKCLKECGRDYAGFEGVMQNCMRHCLEIYGINKPR